jgi:hypothetical protein
MAVRLIAEAQAIDDAAAAIHSEIIARVTKQLAIE